MQGKFCPQCGAPTQGAKFCPDCGARVDGAQTAPAAPPPSPVAPAVPPAGASEPTVSVPAPELPAVTADATRNPTANLREGFSQAEPAEPVGHPTVPAAAAPAADTVEGETDETDEADEADADSDETEPQSGVKQAVKKSTKIKVDVTAEPYVPGKCTVNLVLAIQPDDGNSNGPLVVAGVSSHDQAPQFSTFRLDTLGLPPTLLAMVQAYQASLPQRGADRAADEARAARKKAAEEAKRKADAAARQAKSKTPAAKAAATAKPATPAKPETPKATPVSLATLF